MQACALESMIDELSPPTPEAIEDQRREQMNALRDLRRRLGQGWRTMPRGPAAAMSAPAMRRG
jgi:hypothetical protein